MGIVGRTGAGKSSIVQALMQVAETEGSIYIDDVDVANLGLHDVRGSVSVIPQVAACNTTAAHRCRKFPRGIS